MGTLSDYAGRLESLADQIRELAGTAPDRTMEAELLTKASEIDRLKEYIDRLAQVT